MTTPDEDLGFTDLAHLQPDPPKPDDAVMDEFRALVFPSSQLPPSALSTKDFSAQTLGDSLKSFIRQLTESLGHAADDLGSLEVRTFGTPDLSKVEYDYASKSFTGDLQVRSVTRIAFDGDVQSVLPETLSQTDEPVWNAHVTMVREAQANRAQFLGAMAELATRLIQLFR